MPAVRDAVLRGLLASTSRYVMFPLQDVFGWDARINTPATVNDANWTWRVPVPVDRWRESPEWVERAALAGRVDARLSPLVTGPVTAMNFLPPPVEIRPKTGKHL